jgi:hypothetical protein
MHFFHLSYAIRVIVKFAFCTSITGAGVTVGSVVAGTESTLRLKQQHLGTLIIAVLVTLPKSSAAAGVKIALEVNLGSPLTAIATAIGVTVPPSGIAILPLNSTRYCAKQLQALLELAPLRIKFPVSPS